MNVRKLSIFLTIIVINLLSCATKPQIEYKYVKCPIEIPQLPAYEAIPKDLTPYEKLIKLIYNYEVCKAREQILLEVIEQCK